MEIPGSRSRLRVKKDVVKVPLLARPPTMVALISLFKVVLPPAPLHQAKHLTRFPKMLFSKETSYNARQLCVMTPS
jgi:hypothetical protein